MINLILEISSQVLHPPIIITPPPPPERKREKKKEGEKNHPSSSKPASRHRDANICRVLARSQTLVMVVIGIILPLSAARSLGRPSLCMHVACPGCSPPSPYFACWIGSSYHSSLRFHSLASSLHMHISLLGLYISFFPPSLSHFPFLSPFPADSPLSLGCISLPISHSRSAETHTASSVQILYLHLYPISQSVLYTDLSCSSMNKLCFCFLQAHQFFFPHSSIHHSICFCFLYYLIANA